MTDDKIIQFSVPQARVFADKDAHQDFPIYAVAKAEDATQASIEVAKAVPLTDALRQVFSLYPTQMAIKGAVTVDGCIVHEAIYARESCFNHC